MRPPRQSSWKTKADSPRHTPNCAPAPTHTPRSGHVGAAGKFPPVWSNRNITIWKSRGSAAGTGTTVCPAGTWGPRPTGQRPLAMDLPLGPVAAGPLRSPSGGPARPPSRPPPHAQPSHCQPRAGVSSLSCAPKPRPTCSPLTSPSACGACEPRQS